MKKQKQHPQTPLTIYLWIALGFFMLMLLSLHIHKDTFFERAVNNLWRIIYLVVVHYILFEFTVPYIARKRTTILYNILVAVPLVFVHLMLYSFGLYAWRQLGISMHVYSPFLLETGKKPGVDDQMQFSMMSLVVFAVSRHIYHYLQLKQATQQLRIEKQAAELNYLKSQTNPHFLFNTLNNIYALSRDKNDLAPESILRLSKILRYMLYEAGGDYVSIEKELKIIHDYIDLEKLRYDDSLRINFNHDVEDMRQAIPPLLLIPLVENAFKHGVSETRGQPFIDIHLSVNNRQLKFVVKNSSEVTAEAIVKENIGLSNLRRQLELLFTAFDVTVQQASSVFTATLQINLASHV